MTYAEFNPPQRLLLGPGPSMVHPRVYQALSKPLVGHLDPSFLTLMNEVQQMLREVFLTKNPFTIAISGTGSAGMEAALVNILEPGDAVIVCVNGVFGTRMLEIVNRIGAIRQALNAPWGKPLDLHQIEVRLKKGHVKAVAIVHAETSTGVLQPLQELGRICHEHDALLIVDAVTSLGGVELRVDDWGIDVCYSGTQKCLSCPPGLSPITFSERALKAIRKRKNQVQSWYLDMNLIADYWAEGKRVYHHTAPISMNYALREALRIVLEEGLELRWLRHREMSKFLLEQLQSLQLESFIDVDYRLPSLNAIRVPENISEHHIRASLLKNYGIEIGGGLGELKGKIWRIGLMGESCQKSNVVLLCSALKELLKTV